MAANLTYSIFEGLITGFAGGHFVHIYALSGGGGGSKTNAPTMAVNNPYMEGLKTQGAEKAKNHVHGGPIPPGQYIIAAPDQKHFNGSWSAQLLHPNGNPMGRSGFFIHGRGPHGSDGCIVPMHPNDFSNLMNALIADVGGTLFVVETMDGDRFV